LLLAQNQFFVPYFTIGILIATCYLKKYMSQAFVKESDEEWLHEIPPTMPALINYLTRQNNGIRVYEQKTLAGGNGKEQHVMSNGLTYATDDDSRWYIV